MNMTDWLNGVIKSKVKKGMPILSFPGTSLLNVSVRDLISSSDLQAQAMKSIADRVPSAASVSLMDLSVEAECFGSNIRFSENEVPVVVGRIVESEDDANALTVPQVGTARTQIYIDAVKKAKQLITDRPVFAGIIGSFSLAGRLVDVTEALVNCYEEPDMMHVVLDKCTEFLIAYAKEYKKACADGIVIAEPLTGLLSPELAEEFSEPYLKRIVQAVQSEDFMVIYHNCGNSVIKIMNSILRVGAAAYHFGNAVNMADVMPLIPQNIVAMGNVDPSSQFKNGTVESVKAETTRIMKACCLYPNFVISSGCDIPPTSKWENIDAFFAAINEFYSDKQTAL